MSGYDRSSRFAKAMEAVVKKSQDASQHPETDELAAYHGRVDLDDETRGRIQEHVAVCRECASVLLALPVPLDDDRITSDIEIPGRLAEAAFERVRDRLPAPVGGRISRREAVAWALAACLLMSTGISIWWGSARHALVEGNALIVDAFPAEDAARRGEDDFAVKLLPRWATSCVFVLHVRDAGGFSDYEAAISLHDKPKSNLRIVHGLRSSQFGSFTVRFESGNLETGLYEIELRGVKGDQRVPVAAYRIRIEKEGDPRSKQDTGQEPKSGS